MITYNLHPINQKRLIGQGSQGSVYQVTQGNRTLAIKYYDNGIDQDEKQFLDLLMKTSIESPMMKIYKHYQSIENKYCLEQQYFEGGSLDKKLSILQRADIEQIILQIGKQLEFIHNNGYVYQDLKPSNIVFGSATESPYSRLYKLCDFGAIRKVNNTEKVFNPEKRIGTVNYLPFDEYTDCSLDIFSFGALIYELIFKQQLFQGTNLDEIKRAKRQFYESQTEIYEKIDQQQNETIQLKNMLKRMLDPNTNNRPKIQEVNQFFQSNFINCDDCKKQQLECLKLKDQIKILIEANFDLQEIIRKLNEKQQEDLCESFSTQMSEEFLYLNGGGVCNIQLAEKIEILNQKLYRSSGRKFKQNGNTGLVLLEQQIEYIIKEFVYKVKEDCQLIIDLKENNLKLNEQLKVKDDQLIIKDNQLIKLNEQLKVMEDQLIMKENQFIKLKEQLKIKDDQLIMKENQLMKLKEQLKVKDDQFIIIKNQLTESMREKYGPQKQIIKVVGSHNQNTINNLRSQNNFLPNLLQNRVGKPYQ